MVKSELYMPDILNIHDQFQIYEFGRTLPNEKKKQHYNTREAILFISDIKVIVKENTLSNKQTKGIREIIKIVKYQNVRKRFTIFPVLSINILSVI